MNFERRREYKNAVLKLAEYFGSLEMKILTLLQPPSKNNCGQKTNRYIDQTKTNFLSMPKYCPIFSEKLKFELKYISFIDCE